MSAAGLQLPVEPSSDCWVVRALVERLPKKSCEWEAPGRFGRTIGSSGSRWLIGHSARNSATRTGAPCAAPGTLSTPAASARIVARWNKGFLIEAFLSAAGLGE